MARAAVLAALVALTISALAGCGGDGGETTAKPGLPAAGGGGSLVYAVPALPATLDPLAARNHAQQTVTRQIHEPLYGDLAGPYGQMTLQRGLVLGERESEGTTVVTLTLRPGVRFQDGTPFNAAAVLANARRWRSTSTGRRLLPNVFAVDAPRPDQVRFLLERPDQNLLSQLGSARLGIVSPQALQRRGGRTRYLPDSSGSGTGPFEVGADTPGRLQLSRNPRWWGSPLGLGPALEGVAFVAQPGSAERLALLQAGTVQVADPLSRAALRALVSDPLLAPVRDPGRGIGLAGSVRGIYSALSVPLLSSVWLTDIAG